MVKYTRISYDQARTLNIHPDYPMMDQGLFDLNRAPPGEDFLIVPTKYLESIIIDRPDLGTERWSIIGRDGPPRIPLM